MYQIAKRWARGRGDDGDRRFKSVERALACVRGAEEQDIERWTLKLWRAGWQGTTEAGITGPVRAGREVAAPFLEDGVRVGLATLSFCGSAVFGVFGSWSISTLSESCWTHASFPRDTHDLLRNWNTVTASCIWCRCNAMRIRQAVADILYN